ncbi:MULTISPECIES: SulP family inorganic anion transporter [Methylocystis]|jgi:MFS superfamily sulfate permease-like transporter|nr:MULTISPECIES: SulP family inorganic anion transporter [Methylocystis]
MVDDAPPGTGREFGGVINLWSLPIAIWKGVPMDAHRPAALLGLLTINSIFAWRRAAPPRLAFLPAPLTGVGLATFAAWHFNVDIKYVPAPDDLLGAINMPTLHALGRLGEVALWAAGLSLAFVAGAESLLTATAVDVIQRRTARPKYNKELVAQGVGNLLCGMLGVLPVSGVIVRSAANCERRRPDAALHHAAWRVDFAAHHHGTETSCALFPSSASRQCSFTPASI